MKYYKLTMSNTDNNDVVLHYDNDLGISQNSMIVGKRYENWDNSFYFFYDEKEGNTWTDYLANDKGWFVVSKRLKEILESVHTDIQFIKVCIRDIDKNDSCKDYYIANILKTVDALCLDKSVYFETFIEGIGNIYTVSKYGIYESKTDGADVFKLLNRQEIPIFVSDRFKSIVDSHSITGMAFQEIAVE